jgi:ubiquinol-cytochrome c reductase cytochrome c1 subunit
MVRPLGILVGLGFVAALMWSFLWGAVSYISEPHEKTAESLYHLHPKEVHFASDGMFGKFDNAQLQRGFQVYKEVCSACHSLRLVAFRDLTGLGYTEPEVKAIAKQWAIEVPDINPDTGEPATRKALPVDHFPSPYANEVAARAANNNALPPDLSLMAKARHGGAPYIYSILTGYQKPPAAFETAEPANLHYNPYFANLNLAMPPPLVADGQVTYADGTKSTVDQMAKDVSAFLIWTAEPKLQDRKSVGVAVTIFLILASVLAYLAYQNVWADIKKRKHA